LTNIRTASICILFTYRSRQAEAAEVRDRIVAQGRKAVALRLDVGDSSSFDSFAAAVGAELARTWQRKHFDSLGGMSL
jgi:hypothetical protein